MEKQQADQMRAMEQIFGPIRSWMSGQGMSSLMGGRNPFTQDPNPQMEQAYLDHINTLRGLQGGYNQAYGNLGDLGGQLLGGAMGALQPGGGPGQPGAPGLGRFNQGMEQFMGPMQGARNAIIGGALPQALEAFNPHLNTAAIQALAGQGQQARNAITETSPMRGGQMASALNQSTNQEAMAKAALTYQAGQEARQNALGTLGPAAMSDQVMRGLSAQIAPPLDIFGKQAQMYGVDKAAEDARMGRLSQLGIAGMPWIEQGQTGPLNMTRDLSQDIMGLISGLYGGAEESGRNRALELLGGSSFPSASSLGGQGSQLAAIEQQRRAANAQAKGSKKGGIGSGLGSLAGMFVGGPLGSALGNRLGGKTGSTPYYGA